MKPTRTLPVFSPGIPNDDLIDHIRLRSLFDAWQQATPVYWLRRADAIETAAPRPGDAPGGGVREPRSGWCRVCGDQFLSSAEAKAAGCCVGLPIMDGVRIGPDCRWKAPRVPAPVRREDHPAVRRERCLQAAMLARFHARLLSGEEFPERDLTPVTELAVAA